MADWAAISISCTPKPSIDVGGIVARDRQAQRGEVARVQPVVAERRVEDERQRRVEQARPGRADVLLRRRVRARRHPAAAAREPARRAAWRAAATGAAAGGGAGGAPAVRGGRARGRRRIGRTRNFERLLLEPQITEQGRKHGLSSGSVDDGARTGARGSAARAPRARPPDDYTLRAEERSWARAGRRPRRAARRADGRERHGAGGGRNARRARRRGERDVAPAQQRRVGAVIVAGDGGEIGAAASCRRRRPRRRARVARPAASRRRESPRRARGRRRG